MAHDIVRTWRMCTPLQVAAQMGHAGVTAVLLDDGADVVAHDQHRGSPLHVAAEHGHVDVAALLIERDEIGRSVEPRPGRLPKKAGTASVWRSWTRTLRCTSRSFSSASRAGWARLAPRR